MLIPLVPWLHAITNSLFAVPGGDGQLPAASAPGVSSASSLSGARVIEFYVPATFQLPERRWVPPEARGKLIEFPKRGVRKSA